MRLLTLPRLALMGCGAAAAYFFDPRSGAERRQQLADRLNEMMGGRSTVDVRSVDPHDAATSGPATPRPGTDTATGTDPDARYTEPGYQDVSFGQAVDRDAQLADRLVEEEGGDTTAAAERFGTEAVGAPALHTQGWSS